MKDNRSLVSELLSESGSLKQSLATSEPFLASVLRAAELFSRTVKANGTVYVCGNGGSACDSMHFVEELVARYKRERRGIRAMHFMDPSTLTCWGNDYSFESAFERQAATFCTDKDLLFGISTSGNSKNVLLAVEAAKKAGTATVGLSGKDGGVLGTVADVNILVPSQRTERIQEVHITIVHILCELIEVELFV